MPCFAETQDNRCVVGNDGFGHAGRNPEEFVKQSPPIFSHWFLSVTFFASLSCLPAAWSQEPGSELEVNLPLGHTNSITGAAFVSPRLLATCSQDATVIVWDIDTGCPLRRLFLPDQAVTLTRLDSGELQVDCGNTRRGLVRAFVNPLTEEMRTEELAETPQEHRIPKELVELLTLPAETSFALRDGDRAVVGFEDGKVELWSLGENQPLRIQKFEREISHTSGVATAGDWVATWSFLADPSSHNLRFWNPTDPRVVGAEPNDSTHIVSGVFVDGGKYFVSCENSRFHWRWNLVVRETRSGRVISSAETEIGRPSILSVVEGEDKIVQTQYGLTGPGVFLWEFRNGQLQQTHRFPDLMANGAVLDSGRNRLYSQEWVVELEGLYQSHDLNGGEGILAARGVPEMFGTVVGMRHHPADDLLLISTFHRGIGYCSVTDLGNGTSDFLEHYGVHSAFARKAGSQLLLGATEGTIRLSLRERKGGALVSEWEYPQSDLYREHLTAAQGWTIQKDSVALARDETTVYVVEPTGAIRILEITSEDQFVSAALLVPLSSEDWAIVSSDGHYASSPGGAAKMSFSREQRTFPFERFDLVYNRPDLVVQKLGAGQEAVDELRNAVDERHLKYAEDNKTPGKPPATAPTITIANREEIGWSQGDSQLDLSLRFSRFPAGEATLVVSANGVEQVRNALPEGETSARIELTLTRGVNLIEIAARFADGSRSLPEVLRVYHRNEALSDLYLLAIGVSDYEEDHLDLVVAAKDARDIVAFAKDQEGKAFRQVHTRLLIDSEVSKEAILASADFFAQAAPEDIAVIFLAGHGMLEAGSFEYHFGTPDIDPNRVGDRGVPYSDLESLLSECASGNRIILMDTCFAGEVEVFDLAEPDSESIEQRIDERVKARSFALANAPARKSGSKAQIRRELFSDLKRSAGANVITASGGMEFVFAGEVESVGNGLFTHCFLEGMRTGEADSDGNGSITVTEISNYLQSSLYELSGGLQRPSFREVNRHSDVQIARCRPYPKIDAPALLDRLLDLTERNGEEDKYAEMFASECDYFGSRKSRAKIAEEEHAYHEKYPERDVTLREKPETEDLGDGKVAITYHLELAMLGVDDNFYHGRAVYDAETLIEQDLRMVAGYSEGRWLIESIEALSSKRIPNPHHRPPPEE